MSKKAKKVIPQDPMTMPVMASEPKKDISGGEDDYEAKGALDDLVRAEAHKANPDLMKRVAKHAQRKAKQMRSIADLKLAYDDEAKKED